jgi:chromate transport protein ChrA
MEVFYDYLAATAGIIVGVFLAFLALGVGSCAAILCLAWLVDRFKKKSNNVVRPHFGKKLRGGGWGHGK